MGSLSSLNTFIPASFAASFVDCLCASLKYAGTVITAPLSSSPRAFSALFLRLLRILAETSIGVKTPIAVLKPTEPSRLTKS